MKIMKKNRFCLLIVFISLFSLRSISQNIMPTTIEEYNYITKGYKTMIESGLDMKKGYGFKELGLYSTSARNCTFKALYRDKESKPCGILCVFKRLDGGYCYLCIPTSDASQEIWNKAIDEINNCLDNSGASKSFNIFLMKLIAESNK